MLFANYLKPKFRHMIQIVDENAWMIIFAESKRLKMPFGEYVARLAHAANPDILSIVDNACKEMERICEPFMPDINKSTSKELFEYNRVISLKVIQGEYLSSELIEIYKTITANPHNMHKIYKINEEQTAEIKTLTAENEKLTAIVESLMKMSNPPQSRDSE